MYLTSGSTAQKPTYIKLSDLFYIPVYITCIFDIIIIIIIIIYREFFISMLVRFDNSEI